MANNIIERIWNQNAVGTIEDLSGSAFQAEAGAHTFVISGVDNAGAAVALSGTVAGVFMKPDNTDVALTGSISNGKASVTLTAECYTVPGRFGLTIFVTSGSVKTAVYAAVGNVSRTNTGNVSASAEADVVDLINRINAAVATVPASWSGLMADIAPTYSASAVYPVGAYVYYNGDLYRCTTAITSAESWTAAHWTAAVLGDDVSSLKSAITYIPYQNIYDPTTNTNGKFINSVGGFDDNAAWVVTDYIPYNRLENEAFYEGITLPGGSPYSAYYDKNKNFIGTFKQTTGKVSMKNALADDPSTSKCCYVRFSLSATQSTDSVDFKFYKKTIATEEDLSDIETGIVDLENSVLTKSPNLLDHTNDTLDKTISVNGYISDSSGYYISDYLEIKPNTAYSQVSYSSGSEIFIKREIGNVCFYDENKSFISGIARSAGNGTVTTPANAKYLRFSSPYNATHRTKDMFGEDAVMAFFYTSPALTDEFYIPVGEYNHQITVLRIEQPYVEYDWRGYWHIKFYRIYYVDFDGNVKNLQYNSYITKKYSNLILTRSPTYKMDTCTIEEGYSFIYSYKKKLFLITQTVEKDDIVFFSVNSGIPSGLLLASFNDQMEFFQQQTIYKTLPIAIKRAVDITLENSGILTSESRSDIFSFVHVSDNHHVGTYMGTSVDLTGMAIKYLHSRATFDAIFNTGDELLTSTAAASGLLYNDGKVALSNAINAYPVPELVYCEGNHDRGIIDEQFITHQEYYNLVVRHWKDNPNVVSEYPNTYYYRNYPDKKIRVICLTLYNMSDNEEDTYPYNDYCGYDQTQMEWLCNDALQLEAGWSAVILVHSAPVTTAEGNTGNGDAGNNPLVLRSILESFMNGTNETITHTSEAAGGFFNINITTDFATQGARPLIGVFSGHTHLDRTVKINDINYEAICCGYIDIVEYSGNRGTRYANEISAVCFDIGVINKTYKTVTLTRVGFIPTDNPVVTQVRTWTYK